MKNLSTSQITEIRDLTNSALQTQLSFTVSFRTTKEILQKASTNWRETINQLHINYPIKGVAMKATPDNLKLHDAEEGGFLFLKKTLDPDDAISRLDSFPLEAASAAYAFTLLEGYGNDLVNIVNPGYLEDRQAWHHAVYGDTDLSISRNLSKAKAGFAKPFNLDVTNIELFVIKRLVKLKHERNSFMHKAEEGICFEDFHAKILGTIAALYFLLLPTETELSAYPYFDYDIP